MTNWQIEPLGDTAFLVRARATTPHVAAQVRAVAAQLAQQQAPGSPLLGLQGWTVGLDTLLVCYDPLETDGNMLCQWLLQHMQQASSIDSKQKTVIEVPVRYGDAGGPDLEDVAHATGLSVAEVVQLHAAGTYEVLMVGFAPGFPYIGGLPAPLHLPRRAVPRTHVPPGSVAIAGDMVGIYPQRSPGGWHLIGHTSLRVFDPRADPPALFQPGDQVRFVPE